MQDFQTQLQHTHYGMFFNLPAREFFRIQMENVQATKKVDVAVAYGSEVRHFTFDEFVFLLGFTEAKQPQQTTK